jgi:exodeoxyribonuclease V gamma subunit
MGYEIFTGRRLETLVGSHLDLFQAGFFGPRPGIVVQSQSLAQWLKLFLARRLGGYATGDILFQDEALRRLLELHASPGRLLFLDELKFELYRRLSAELGGSDAAFAPLAGQSGTPDPARLFELADHIAGVFHNYAMNSTLWPPALSSGLLPQGTGADPAAFLWQSLLWRGLLEGQGTLAGLAMEKLTREPPESKGAPAKLIIVGSAFVSRRAAAFLRAWAEAGLIEVVQLLLFPALPPPHSAWPDRRPWSSWGAFGKAFLETLPDPVAVAEPEPEADPCTALKCLQDALFQGRAVSSAVPDDSLTVVSAPHPLRELEVLRDWLLGALSADPTLELHEIAVLAPDINAYAPFLDAAFASDDPGRSLRHHVIDLDLGREDAWFQALDAVLALVSGTLDRPTLFALVDAPAFREAWKVDTEERDLWLDYTDQVSAWREDQTEASGPQTWEAGADRLYTGWFRVEAAGGVPPLDTSPSAFRSLGRLQQVLDALRSRGREARRSRGFGEWIRFLDQTVAEFLAPGEGAGAVLSGRLRALVRDSEADPVLPWAGFRAFVQDQIAHFPGRRGQLLTEGLHCSSLRPLRAIPFKVIAVLGLDDGGFPRQTQTPSFDLRRHESDQNASSSLSLDRFTFWETLMAARTKLWLSYHGRSAVDGTERPPSPLLADLLDFLEESGAPWPVAEATVKDFSVPPGGPPTWSPRTHRRALALAAGSAPALRDTPPVTDAEVDELFPEVRSSEVVQAFTVPARFHLRRVRQLVLRDEDRRGVDDEEPWSLAFLEREAWLQEQLRRQLAGQTGAWNVEAFLDLAEATGQVRAGVFAERDRRSLRERAQQAAAWGDELKAEGWTSPSAPSSGRPRWADRPRAEEPDGRLVRGRDVLLPRLLYGESLPIRSRVEAAVQFLQDPSPSGTLAVLSPGGRPQTLTWAHDEAATEALAAQAEAYWREAARRPLPFYPDYCEALAKRREQTEPWALSAEEAWKAATKDSDGRARSSSLLARDPYAQLAFGDSPDWNLVAADAALWWEGLFVPLLEAWK